MTVKDFILQIADGSLKKDDILNYANKSWDIKELLWDLHLSNIAIDETLGKPLVTGDTETNRIFNAIEIISKQFDVSICNEIEQQYKDNENGIRSKILLEDKEKVLDQMHRLIDGKIGKDVAIIIGALIDQGVILKPTFKQVENEFGNIGNRSGYNKYINIYKNYITEDERKNIAKDFK